MNAKPGLALDSGEFVPANELNMISQAAGLKVDALRSAAWVTVAERMPPEGAWLLVVWGDHRAVDKAHTFLKWRHPTNPLGYLIQGHPGSHLDVTHWMLLPAPPTDAASGSTS